MREKLILTAMILAGWLGTGSRASAQAVTVTLRLDTNTIASGGTTVLRGFAQVVPTLRPAADRIFSFYVDVLDANSAVASATYASLAKPSADQDPVTSSTGVTAGADRRGIYDTFLNLPGAGVSNAVPLFAIPVRGLGGGTARFSVRAGTGVPGLSSDFIVAPKDGSTLWTAGDYSQASVELTVTGPAAPCINVPLRLQPEAANALSIRFTPCAGHNNTIEARNTLESGTWLPLPGAPHNTGLASVTNSTARRFFRLRIDP